MPTPSEAIAENIRQINAEQAAAQAAAEAESAARQALIKEQQTQARAAAEELVKRLQVLTKECPGFTFDPPVDSKGSFFNPDRRGYLMIKTSLRAEEDEMGYTVTVPGFINVYADGTMRTNVLDPSLKDREQEGDLEWMTKRIVAAALKQHAPTIN